MRIPEKLYFLKLLDYQIINVNKFTKRRELIMRKKYFFNLNSHHAKKAETTTLVVQRSAVIDVLYCSHCICNQSKIKKYSVHGFCKSDFKNCRKNVTFVELNLNMHLKQYNSVVKEGHYIIV